MFPTGLRQEPRLGHRRRSHDDSGRAGGRALLDPRDTEAQFREEVHKLKISELKKERERVVKAEKTHFSGT